jgi:hypothetical protein
MFWCKTNINYKFFFLNLQKKPGKKNFYFYNKILKLTVTSFFYIYKFFYVFLNILYLVLYNKIKLLTTQPFFKKSNVCM